MKIHDFNESLHLDNRENEMFLGVEAHGRISNCGCRWVSVVSQNNANLNWRSRKEQDAESHKSTLSGLRVSKVLTSAPLFLTLRAGALLVGELRGVGIHES